MKTERPDFERMAFNAKVMLDLTTMPAAIGQDTAKQLATNVVTLAAYARALEQRLADAEAVVRGLLELDSRLPGWARLGERIVQCGHCYAFVTRDKDARDIVHKDDCPVAKGRALLDAGGGG